MKKLPSVAAGLVVLLFAVVSAFAQEEQSGMIKTADGVLVVWNEPGNYFTIEIKGQRIEPAERPMMFAVDGKFTLTPRRRGLLRCPPRASLLCGLCLLCGRHVLIFEN